MPQPLTQYGEIFREDFLSPFHVAENGGVIGNGALVNRGLTISANNQSVRYTHTFPNVNDFTLSIKGSFDIESSNDYGALFYFRVGTSANDNTIRIFKTPASSRLTFRIANGSGSRDCAMDSGTEVPETESIVHFTRSGNTLKIYVNGVEQASTTSGSSITGALPLNNATVKAIGFGDHVAGIKGQYKGWKMRNYAMSAEEIADDYNNSTFTYGRSLVAHWPMNDKIGSAAPFTTTELVQGADATLGDGSTSSTFPTKLTYINGFSYDGGDYLLATPSNVPTGGNARTISLWAKRTTLAGGPLMSINTSSGQRFIVSDAQTTGVNYVFTDGVNGANNQSVTYAQRAQLGRFAHHVFSLDGSNGWAYYLDGSLVKSGTFTIAIDTGTVESVSIGHRTDLSQSFTGEIYDARLFNIAFTATQAKHLYSQGPYYLGMK